VALLRRLKATAVRRIKQLKALKHWVSVLSLAALAGCGGGSDSSTNVGPVTGTQQYPEGVWEGSTGTSTAQRPVFGFISGGSDGKGGNFYLAKGAAGSSSYDGMFGLLRTDIATAQATGVTYFSVQDGKFSTAVSLIGTLSASVTGGRTDTLVGNYTSPANTAAATTTITPFKLSYSRLNNFPAQYSLIQGSYTGGSLFGGSWLLNVDAVGNITGTVSGCTVTGTATPRIPGPNSSSTSAAYTLLMNLSGAVASCASTGTSQSGVAILNFDTLNQKTGIWLLTVNTSGTLNTLVLNGVTVASNIVPPAATQQSPVGFWKPAVSTGVTDLYAVVMPDNSYFFYKRAGGGYDTFFGNLVVATGTSIISSTDGVYFANQNAAATQYTSNVTLSGDARTNLSLRGSYADPTQAGAQTAFSLVPDTTNLFTAPIPASVTGLYNLSFTSAPIGFGGTGITLSIAASQLDPTKSVITGTTTNGCTVTGNISPYSSNTQQNLYSVSSLSFAGAGCPLTGQASQSGMASAIYDAAGANITGLRMLTAGAGAAGARTNLVFIGTRN
jgi:hypothetical protein